MSLFFSFIFFAIILSIPREIFIPFLHLRNIYNETLYFFKNLMLKLMKITVENSRIPLRIRARRMEGTTKAANAAYQLLVRLKSHVEPRGRERASQLAVVRVANNWEPRVAA